MVNHYVLSNEELIDQLIDVIKCSLDVDTENVDEDFDIDSDCIFNYKRRKEYYDIRKELLYRLSDKT